MVHSIKTERKTDRDPVVVLAADENFAMPLAVTIRSALENLGSDRQLQIYVLDGGISSVTKERLVRSWPEGRFRVVWVPVDASALAHMPISNADHVNIVTYFRILLPSLVPADVRRAIYLDSDLLICADLTRLWECEIGSNVCLAAQDCAAPYLDSTAVLKNYQRCMKEMGALTPISNFRELGLAPEAEYFNAGVLLIDLDAWRDDDVSTQLIECLTKNRQHVRWWDQYAMNVVLAGRWGRLDPRWNQGSHIYRYLTWEQSPFDRASFEEQRDDPYIVHFTTREKPWRALCRHPLRHKFRECIERTEWAGWRLPRHEIFMAALSAQERRFRHGRRRLFEWAQRALSPAA